MMVLQGLRKALDFVRNGCNEQSKIPQGPNQKTQKGRGEIICSLSKSLHWGSVPEVSCN